MRGALSRLAAAAAQRLPARAIRWLGRRQFAGPLSRRLIGRASESLRHVDVTIAHGAGAGLRFNAGGANPGYALGTSEPIVQETLARVLNPGAVFYDIGANVGFYSVLAARLVGPEGRVVAYEPLPENVRALERNIELNQFENVTVRPCAVSANDGRGSLQLAPEQTWARLESAGERADALGSVEVTLVAIDSELAGGLPAPDVVKLDVEGAEVDVLDGMAETIRSARPIVLAEMHGRNRQVGERLRAAGYRLETLDADEPLDEAPWWVHVLAIPTESSTSS